MHIKKIPISNYQHDKYKSFIQKIFSAGHVWGFMMDAEHTEVNQGHCPSTMPNHFNRYLERQTCWSAYCLTTLPFTVQLSLGQSLHTLSSSSKPQNSQSQLLLMILVPISLREQKVLSRHKQYHFYYKCSHISSTPIFCLPFSYNGWTLSATIFSFISILYTNFQSAQRLWSSS